MTWRANPWLGRAGLLGLMLLLAALRPDATAAQDGPGAVVEQMNQALLETMQSADQLGYAGRYTKLEPVLDQVFDFPFMTRAAVGRTWRELGEAEQAELTRLFGDMSVATFASRFDGYSGEAFEIVGQREGPRDTVMVETELVRPEDPPVGIDYLLHQTEDGWSVIDVFLDDKFSELARQRAEFTAVLRRGGYQELVASLEERIADLAQEG